jgi:hypothetical protein
MKPRRTFVVVLLLAVAVAGTGLEGFRASMKAMACCARTHGACAGLDSPDDCCRRMGHTPSSVPSAVPTARDEASAPMALVAIMPVASTLAAVLSSPRRIAEPAFKRPHDPPHLHPVPLLI